MKQKLEMIVFVAALLTVTIVAAIWNSARHQSQHLDATLAAQNAVIQQSREREAQRDSELTEFLSKIQAQKHSIHTSQQAAAQLTNVLPELPLPVLIQTPTLSKLQPSQAPPDDSTTLKIPAPDVIPLYDALQDCRASAAENQSLKKDLADEKSRTAALTTERTALTTKAHTNGTFLTRLKAATKWFTIGLVAGTAVATATRR